MNTHTENAQKKASNRFIPIAIILSVLVHLGVFLLPAHFELHETPKKPKSATMDITLKQSNPKIVAPITLPSPNNKQLVKKTTPKDTEKKAPLKKRDVQKKEPLKETLAQKMDLSAPQTSGKTRLNPKNPKGGITKKGVLTADAIMQKTKTGSSSQADTPLSPKKNTKQITQKTTGDKPKEATNASSPSQQPIKNKAPEKPSQAKPNTPNKKPVKQKITSAPKSQNKPSKQVAHTPIDTKPVTTPNETSDSNREHTQIPNADTNPLFAAIKNAKQSNTVASPQLGNLQPIDEIRLSNESIGDPFSEFETLRNQVNNQYLTRMSEQVRQRWSSPDNSTPLKTRIKLYLSAGGYISDIYIEESSGSLPFDLAALKAIKSVNRFDLPPNRTYAKYFRQLVMTLDNFLEIEKQLLSGESIENLPATSAGEEP